MKLRAEILIEMDVANYVEAAEHQKALQGYLDDLRGNYPEATLDIRERRQREQDNAASVRVFDPRVHNLVRDRKSRAGSDC